MELNLLLVYLYMSLRVEVLLSFKLQLLEIEIEIRGIIYSRSCVQEKKMTTRVSMAHFSLVG